MRALLPPWREIWPSVLLGFLTVIGGVGLLGAGAWLLSLAGGRPASVLLLVVPITLVRFMSLMRSTSRYGERIVSHRSTLSHLARLKGRVFTSLAARTPPEIAHGASGDFLRRMTADVDRLQNLLLDALAPPAVFALVSAAAVGVLAWLVGWAAAVILGAGLLAAGVAVPACGLIATSSGRVRLASQGGRVAGRLVDAAQSMADLLMTPLGGSVRASLERDAAALAVRQADLDRALATVRGEALLLAHLTAVAVLACAVPAVRAGRLDGVLLGAIVLGTSATFEAAAPLLGAIPAAAEDADAARRILVPAIVRPRGAACTGDTGIELRGVGFAYEGGPPLLGDVDLILSPGHHVAVEGPSGAGKSTLVLLLAGLLRPTAGRITVGGVEPADLDEGERARLIAVVPQRPQLFSGTIASNIALGAPGTGRGEILAAARAAGLGPLLATLPKGLGTEVGEGGLRLSGGEMGRVAIARALVMEAPILLLDEALTGLDDQTAVEVARALAAFGRGRSVLAVLGERLDAMGFNETWRLADGTMRRIDLPHTSPRP